MCCRTEEEVRKAVTAGAADPGTETVSEQTPEQKKAQAEYEAKRKEVESKNAKAEKTNEVVNRVVKEGAAAFEAKDYDTAIAKYTEGYEIDPDFVGGAPAPVPPCRGSYRKCSGYVAGVRGS